MPDTDRQGLAVVVVTHGQLAHELVNAAEMIAGELVRFEAVALGWHDDPNAARDQIAAAVARVLGSSGVLILTDMFGGTPSNLAISLLEPGRVEVIAGINLPMLIRLGGARKAMKVVDAVAAAREAGRKYITVASEVLGEAAA